MSSTEIVKTIEDSNIIVDNIIDGDKTDNNIIDNNKTNVDDNDCIEMTLLSPEKVRKMLREFGFDNKEVEYIEEYPEISYECKKGRIPKWVSQKVQSVNPGRIIPGTGTPARSYPDYHFLYRGIRTSDTIPMFLLRIALVSSVNNEFGPGLYYTPNFNLAVEYAGKNGAIFVYDWSNLDGDFTIKTLIDREWEDTVKGWICIIDDDSKPGPPQFDEDIIQGPVSKNHGSIYNCSKPIQSQDLQVVTITTNENPEGIEYGENHLIIINDKLEKCLGESIRDAIDDVCEIIERWQKRVAKRYNQNFNCNYEEFHHLYFDLKAGVEVAHKEKWKPEDKNKGQRKEATKNALECIKIATKIRNNPELIFAFEKCVKDLDCLTIVSQCITIYRRDNPGIILY
ncbi:unnamed protein product [Rhizophagus irregularis]|nr:unnamed protein product [Rhizophagus irregularis]